MPEETFALPEIDVRSLPGSDDIFRKILPNGVILLVRENFANPSVLLQGTLEVGALDNPAEKLGLANLVALGLMRGTAQRSFSEIFHTIESIGARLGVSASVHATQFRGKALAEDVALLIDLLADVLKNPIFPQTEMEILRMQHLTGLTLRDEDTGSRAQMAFDELAYPDHPYGVPSEGYRETVEALSMADIREFHKRWYAPEGMILAVVGAVHAQDVFDLASHAFSDWDAKRESAVLQVGPASAPDHQLRTDVFLPGKSQSDLIIGAPGPARSHSLFQPAVLGNSILGRFGLFGRVGEAVREEAGLAYYAYSTVSGGSGPGPWQVAAGVNPQGVNHAIELIRREITRFTSEPVSEEELLENKANFIGRMPLQLESNEGVAGAMVHIERHKLGLDYYREYPGMIAGISAADILAAASTFLHPERLAIGVAGEAIQDPG
ncbi:MAG: insulinase family protein [Anaerolineales bacterium]|nr:insulinase family protein [Anaerolineales bacterium]